MFEKWSNHHLLLLASLTAASSAGFAQTQVGQNEQATFFSKSLAMVAARGKLLADRGYIVTPWLSGCLGVDVDRHPNRMYHA